MQKENGMLKPKEDLESASTMKGKAFVCKSCGSKRMVLGHRFGYVVLCDKCEGKMEEYFSEE